jgi:hypothetical protein
MVQREHGLFITLGACFAAVRDQIRPVPRSNAWSLYTHTHTQTLARHLNARHSHLRTVLTIPRLPLHQRPTHDDRTNVATLADGRVGPERWMDHGLV